MESKTSKKNMSPPFARSLCPRRPRVPRRRQLASQGNGWKKRAAERLERQKRDRQKGAVAKEDQMMLILGWVVDCFGAARVLCCVNLRYLGWNLNRFDYIWWFWTVSWASNTVCLKRSSLAFWSLYFFVPISWVGDLGIDLVVECHLKLGSFE